MINEWLDAITDLILTAPGNVDLGNGPLWPSTLARLGESSILSAANRVYDDYLEADVNAADYRPFFVLVEHSAEWRKYDTTMDLAAHGVVELAYTEQSLDKIDGTSRKPTHKEVVRYFRNFLDNLIQSCAERARSAGVPIAAIRLAVPPQRTARTQRDPNDPTTDYCWGAWHFTIGNHP